MLFYFRTKELSETTRLKEFVESNLKINEEKLKTLNEEKANLDLKYREQALKLTNLQVELENYSSLLQQNTKNNSFLKV